MTTLLCKFHFQLTSNHLAQNTLHEICWLGSVFLSEGERKTPIFELPQNTDVLLMTIKHPLKREAGRGRLSAAVCTQPSQPGIWGEEGLTPEPAKWTGVLPWISLVKNWALGQSKQNISDPFLFQNTHACPQARSNLLYTHSITLTAIPAPLSIADTKVKQQLKPPKGTAAAPQLEAI